MGLFIENGKVKSSTLLNSFMLSLVYVMVYVLAFAGTGWLVEKYIPAVSSKSLLVWLPPAGISLAASFICAIPLFFRPCRQTVGGAFLFIAFYGFFLAGLLFLKSDGETWKVLTKPVIFYLVFPALGGNLLYRVIITLTKC